ncbi:hypothetical protein HN011_002105 [Eciton burchellii]|nr:hypothetical protein HN011_002105 [Eciton burchellii]
MCHNVPTNELDNRTEAKTLSSLYARVAAGLFSEHEQSFDSFLTDKKDIVSFNKWIRISSAIAYATRYIIISRFAARDRIRAPREHGVGLIDGVVTQFELITMKIEVAIAIHIPACSRRIGLYRREEREDERKVSLANEQKELMFDLTEIHEMTDEQIRVCFHLRVADSRADAR